eukprot:4149446-Lingulodinium_polyedra.AAC.1
MAGMQLQRSCHRPHTRCQVRWHADVAAAIRALPAESPLESPQPPRCSSNGRMCGASHKAVATKAAK